MRWGDIESQTHLCLVPHEANSVHPPASLRPNGSAAEKRALCRCPAPERPVSAGCHLRREAISMHLQAERAVSMHADFRGWVKWRGLPPTRASSPPPSLLLPLPVSLLYCTLPLLTTAKPLSYQGGGGRRVEPACRAAACRTLRPTLARRGPAPARPRAGPRAVPQRALRAAQCAAASAPTSRASRAAESASALPKGPLPA